MDIIKSKPKKSYIRVLFKNKVFLMLRRCQINDIWERRSVLWKGMQVTKNEHTIMGTPVITFSKPYMYFCAAREYHSGKLLSYATTCWTTHISSYSPLLQHILVFWWTKVLWNEKLLFLVRGAETQNAFLNTHFWILLKCQFVCLHT